MTTSAVDPVARVAARLEELHPEFVWLEQQDTDRDAAPRGAPAPAGTGRHRYPRRASGPLGILLGTEEV